MSEWLQDYKESVSWGDEIKAGLANKTEYCSHTCDGETLCTVPGFLSDIRKAVLDAMFIKWVTKAKTAILFIDKEATEAQVEEAIHRACDQGVGCGFLHAQPAWLWYGLLDKYMEGTLLEEAIKVMQEGNN